jgi:hypothetical protein
MPEIIVYNPMQLGFNATAFRIFIDEQEGAPVVSGKSNTYQVGDGIHTVQCRQHWMRSKPQEITLYNNDRVELQIGFNTPFGPYTRIIFPVLLIATFVLKQTAIFNNEQQKWLPLLLFVPVAMYMIYKYIINSGNFYSLTVINDEPNSIL